MRTAAVFLASLSIVAALAEPGRTSQSSKGSDNKNSGWDNKNSGSNSDNSGNSGWDSNNSGNSGWDSNNSGNKNSGWDSSKTSGWSNDHTTTWTGRESCSYACATKYTNVPDICDNRESVRVCIKQCQPEVSEGDWYGLYQKQDNFCNSYKSSGSLDSEAEPAQNVARSYGYDNYNDYKGYDNYGSGGSYDSSYPYTQRSQSSDQDNHGDFPIFVYATVEKLDSKRGGYGGYDNGCCPYYSDASMTSAVGFLAPMAAALAVGFGRR